MIQLIIGEKGKGKTKVLLEMANTEIKAADGNFIYLDKNKQHMYDLNNKIRLIDVSSYPVENTDQFLGFLAGLISQDRDLEKVYLDSFLKIADVDEANANEALAKVAKIADAFRVNFVISISVVKSQLSEENQAFVIKEV